jgi:hypothetical protein
MAEVEWDHEAYFRAKAVGHPLARFIPVWAPPPPRADIRAAFPPADQPAALQGSSEKAAATPLRVG